MFQLCNTQTAEFVSQKCAELFQFKTGTPFWDTTPVCRLRQHTCGKFQTSQNNEQCHPTKLLLSLNSHFRRSHL